MPLSITGIVRWIEVRRRHHLGISTEAKCKHRLGDDIYDGSMSEDTHPKFTDILRLMDRGRRRAAARDYLEWLRSEQGRAQVQLGQEMRMEQDRARKQARELAALHEWSEEVESDVRTKFLAAAEERREVYSTIFLLRSSERMGMRLVWATWGLVFFTAALVAATIVLIIVTAKVHL